VSSQLTGDLLLQLLNIPAGKKVTIQKGAGWAVVLHAAHALVGQARLF
jgi:hypothetical protein